MTAARGREQTIDRKATVRAAVAGHHHSFVRSQPELNVDTKSYPRGGENVSTIFVKECSTKTKTKTHECLEGGTNHGRDEIDAS